MLFEQMFLRAFYVGSVLNNTSNSPFLQHSRNRTRDCYFCLFLFSFLLFFYCSVSRSVNGSRYPECSKL